MEHTLNNAHFILTFAGQGSPWLPAADAALAASTPLSDDFAAAERLLEPVAKHVPPFNPEPPATRPAHSTPGILLVQLATLDALAEAGVNVQGAGAYLGHSQGVLAAAAAAEELTRPEALALARLIGAAIEKVAWATGYAGRAMRAVVGRGRREVEEGIAKHGDEIVLGLCNARDEFVLTGQPDALDALDLKAQPLKVDAAFHHPVMHRAVEMVETWAAEVGLPARSASRLARAVLTDRVDWPRDLRHAVEKTAATWILDVGPGAHLSALNRKVVAGRGIGTLTAAEALQSSREAPRRPEPWATYLPRHAGDRVITRFTELTGYPPVLLAGMTPGTVDPAIVAAAANAGFWAELAGGGHHTPGMLQDALRALTEQLDAGKSAQFNALYLDAARWREQVESPRGIAYLREAGAPINGVVVSAGIPPVEKAVALVRRLRAAAIPWVAFKPGTPQQVRSVLALADALPHVPIILQLEGGKAGGHHSWSRMEDTLADTYGDIRARRNVVLTVGGGIGTPERAADFLTGQWAAEFDLPAAPVDGIFIGTAAMAARESTASPAVKEALVATPGTSEWIAPGRAAGGVAAARSHLDADLYELDNAWAAAGRLIEPVENVADRRADIIAALARTAKPYFGEMADMTYEKWLRRYLELSYLPVGGGHDWVDKSWQERFDAMVGRAEARLIEQDEGDFNPAVAGTALTSQSPARAVDEVVRVYPDAARQTVHPADRYWFIDLVRGSGKPPGFVPVIDDDIRWWFRRDSLWQAHHPYYPADAVCAIPGPVAVAGIKETGEPVADILRRFEAAGARRLREVGAAEYAPEEGSDDDAAEHTVNDNAARSVEAVRSAPVIDWAGRPWSVPAGTEVRAHDGEHAVLLLPTTTGAIEVPVTVEAELPRATAPRVSRQAATRAMREWATSAAGGWLPVVSPAGTAECTAEVGPDVIGGHAAAVRAERPLADALVGPAWPAIFAVLADQPGVAEELSGILHAEHRIDALALEELNALRMAPRQVNYTARIAGMDTSGAARRVTVAVDVRAGHDRLARLREVFRVAKVPGELSLDRHGDRRGGRVEDTELDWRAVDGVVIDKPRSFVRRATLNAPRDMREFAAATGDFNPLHQSGGQNGEPAIVHGMWTSAAVQAIVGEVTDWHADMLAPVRCGDEITVTVERIGVHAGGGEIHEATATVDGVAVLRATGAVVPPRTFYAFPGQGIQHQGMGMEAYGASPSARAIWDRADRHTREHLGFSIVHIVRANPRRVRVAGEDFTHPEGVVNLTQFTQVAMAVLAYAQVAQLKEEGTLARDAYFAGHSVGEYTALAAFAGVFSLEAVIDIVYRRGLTMYRMVSRDSHGVSDYGMAALRPHKAGIAESDVAEFVAQVAAESGEFLEIANYNVAGRQYAIAGTRAGLDTLERAAAGPRAVVRIPGLDVPFHSSRLVGGVDDFRAHLEKLMPADIPYERLLGRYIPNLVARPFALDISFLDAVSAVVDSPVISRLRAQLVAAEEGAIFDEAGFARTLLIEILAWQFASPVRWIETQKLILGKLEIERFVEVGVAQAPTLANMLGQSMRVYGTAAEAVEVFNLERDPGDVFATVVREPAVPEETSEDRLEDGSVDEPTPESDDAKPNAVGGEPAQPKAQEKPAVSPERPADKPLSVEAALRLLLAVWIGVRPEQIGATDSIETLVDGVSSRRNQILLDVWSEFGVGSIAGAAEMPVGDLAAGIAKKSPGYGGFGPVLAQTTAAALNGLAGPAGQKVGYVAERVSHQWALGPGWSDRVVAELTTGTRSGDSVRGGSLATLPHAAPGNRQELNQLIDTAVVAAGRTAGVDIAPPEDAAGSEGVKLDGQAFEAVLARATSAVRAAAEAAVAELRDGLGAPDGAATGGTGAGEGDVAAAPLNPDREVASAVRRELGDDWVQRVCPIFSPEKVVVFDDRWASAREDLLRASTLGEDPAGSFVGLGENLARMADYLGAPEAAAQARRDPGELPFYGRVAVVTGASPDSIAAAIAAELLRGGAHVVTTTSSLSEGRLPADRREFYRALYRDNAAGRARLDVAPVNLAAFADIDAFADWLADACVVPWALFPFAAPSVAGTLADAGPQPEAQMRLLLWSVERLMSRLSQVGDDTCIGERVHVVLPGSPNRGMFGGDGAYGEAKAAFDAIVARWTAEPAWAERVALLHAHIGWVRGTGLMRDNDDLVGAAQNAGVTIFTPADIARQLVGFLASGENRARMARAPQELDLTGGLRDSGIDLRQLREQVGTGEKAPTPSVDEGPFTLRALPTPRDEYGGVGVPSASAAAEFSGAQQALEDMVVIVGAAELGPLGSSRTRWEIESTGALSAAGVVELAWQMGLIRFDSGTGWVTAEGEEIAEEDIAGRFRDRVLAGIGVRRFADDFGPVEPMADNLAPGLATIYLDRDLTFEVPEEDTARQFERAGAQIVPTASGWQVTRPKGTQVRVPKRMTMSRVVGGQIPDGFDPGVWGISRDMQRNLDRAAVWNLVCTVDAFRSAGCSPQELLRAVHPAKVASTQGTGMGGVQSLRALYVNGLLGEARQNEVLQETLPNVIAAHVMQDYVGGYGAQNNPVGACATAAVSVEQATDLLRLRKADFVVAGAVDDLNAETITGFGDMGATADSQALAERGVEERYYSRPNDRRRAGFVEAAGGGTLLLTQGDIAANMGLPVRAVVGYAGSFADGLNVSIPAPGFGLVAAAQGGAESPLARGLAQFGLTGDDIAVISKHDTSTAANDPHESDVHERIAAALGRAEGSPLPVVSQKSLTGHAKGAAAAFQLAGLTQVLAQGVIPPNRSLDCVDPQLRSHPHLVWLRRSFQSPRILKCGLVTSLGFGHISALIALVHPAAFRARLAAERGGKAAHEWAEKASARERAGIRRLQEAMYGGVPLYRRPRGRNLGADSHSAKDTTEAEVAMLLDPDARIETGRGE